MIQKIGLGGGCHWCAEGVFQSLIGIHDVAQGWISSCGENVSFSEAVIVTFDDEIIRLKDLVEIHLYSHSSTSEHSFRKKYRSAIYTYDDVQSTEVQFIIEEIQLDFEKEIITKVLPYREFKLNQEEQLNYLYTRKDNGFCTTYIHPKLSFLFKKFGSKMNKDKIALLNLQVDYENK